MVARAQHEEGVSSLQLDRHGSTGIGLLIMLAKVAARNKPCCAV